MNLKELFDMQRTLDERIIKQHGLEGQDLLDQRILALNVELAELAQETRCFKFWSANRQPSERVLDELVDVLHFVLSVGLELKLDTQTVEHLHSESTMNRCFRKENVVNILINHMFNSISQLLRFEYFTTYIAVWSDFIDLYINLGFTWEQVTQAYMEKNKENHDRQDRGY